MINFLVKSFIGRSIVYSKYIPTIHFIPLTAQIAIAQRDSIMDILSELFDGILYAAPKKRRSLRVRRWKRKFRALKPRTDIEDCTICGHKKLMGHLCENCFSLTMKLTEQVWQKQLEDKKIHNGRHVR